MSTKRNYVRVCCSMQVFEGEVGKTSIGVAKNISQTGLFLKTKKQWPLETQLVLRLKYRLWDLLVRSRAVHHQKDGVGFQFVELDDILSAQIKGLIKSLLSDGAWFDDRREQLRIEVPFHVVWRIGDQDIESEVLDLSPGGAFINFDFASPLGRTLKKIPKIGSEVLLYFPQQSIEIGEKVMGCQGKVVHLKPSGFGVAFMDIGLEGVAAIRQILEDKDQG